MSKVMGPEALRISIVDDSETTGRIVGTILRSRYWTICGEAADGRTVVEKFKKLKPDVVLFDLSMPDMTGIEAARQMSAADPKVPLVLFTILGLKELEMQPESQEFVQWYLKARRGASSENIEDIASKAYVGPDAFPFFRVTLSKVSVAYSFGPQRESFQRLFHTVARTGRQVE
jgi:two-component system, chemotaxis family, chemotaxis protein CheY